ncbi:hypothetical protein [Natronospora cellulosivora (SeqCode)]
MRNFLEMVEKFLVNFIVIGLILLISLQLIMRTDMGYQRIKNLEYSLRNVLHEDETVEVFARPQSFSEGKILISLEQDYSLPQVWLVKNGTRVANFSAGFVEIAISEGDFLLIDSKFYDQALTLEIKEISPNVRSWHVGQQFRVFSEEKRLGVVEFYDKL